MAFDAPASDISSGGALTAFGDPVLGGTPATPQQSASYWELVKHGLKSSSTGLAIRGELPEQQFGENLSWDQRLAQNVGGVIGDIPTGIVGAVAAAPTGPIGMAAASFAAPMALREALVEAYSNNHALSWSGVWEVAKAAVKGGTKGAVIGAATAGAGRFVAPALAPAGKAIVTTGTLGAELTALTATSSALEGRMPTWQDFMDNAILLGGMKAAVGTAKALHNIYVETGKTPAEVLGDASKNPALKAEILEKMEVPEAYKTLQFDERIKAALDTDKRTELVRAAVAEAAGKPDEALTGDLVRYEYLDSHELVQATIRATAEAFKADVEAQRRGTVPTKASLIDGIDLIKTGELAAAEVGRADAPHEAAARAVLTRDAAVRAKRLITELDALPPAERTPAKTLEAHAAIQQLGMFYKELSGGVAEAARTLRMMREIKRNPEMLGEAESMLKLYDGMGKGTTDLAALARVIKDPLQLAEAAKKISEATTLEKVLEVYRANLFSGLRTHEANFLGNLGKFVVESVEAPIAASIFALESASKGNVLSMAQWKARAFAPITGMVLGIKDGVVAAGEAVLQRDIINGKAETYKLANTGLLKEYTGTVFGLLQAGDMLFRIPAERAQAHILAVDRAVKEGFNPDTMEGRARINEYTRTPQLGLTQKQAEAITAKIEQAGAQAVFAEQLGPRMLAAQRAIAGSWAQFIFPAWRTPVNLLSWAVQHSPGLNLMSARWRADFMAGGERTAQATARVVIGTGLATLAYSWAQDGIITGSGLFDKEMGRTKDAAGIQPNSIKIGNEYYGFDRLEPVAKLFTVAADLNELLAAAKTDEDKAKIGSMLVLAFGNATISTTYLSGLSRTIRAISEPDRYGEQWYEGYAASVVPKIIGQTYEMTDPYKREVDGVLQAIQAQIPMLRDKLLIKRDVWGEYVKNERLFAVLPINTKEMSEDKVKTEAVRLSVAIADAPKWVNERGPFKQKMERSELDQAQRDIFREVSGREAMAILKPIVNSPDWEKTPDFVKQAMYAKVLERTRKMGLSAAAPPDSAAREAVRRKIVDEVLRQTQEAESK